MLLPNFGVPALKEWAVLDFRSMGQMCYCRRWCSCAGWGGDHSRRDWKACCLSAWSVFKFVVES